MSGDRRPLATRGTGWARAVAGWLGRAGISPDAISQASLVAALAAGAGFWAGGGASGAARVALLLGAAVFVQLRLLCNLFDGMVALEGGKAGPAGAFWNEVPDRVADVLILVGAGLGAGAPALGWAAAVMAVATAYLRAMGVTLGQPADFGGPMAKPHRMAVMTAAAILACFEPLFGGPGHVVLRAGLWLVTIGAAVTVLLRARRLLAALR